MPPARARLLLDFLREAVADRLQLAEQPVRRQPDAEAAGCEGPVRRQQRQLHEFQRPRADQGQDGGHQAGDVAAALEAGCEVRGQGIEDAAEQRGTLAGCEVRLIAGAARGGDVARDVVAWVADVALESLG